MSEIGKYIYGVINSNTNLSLFAPKDSSENERVYTISYKDISAVISDSEIADYTRLLKGILAKRLVWHQKVIERIMQLDHAIIPVRLGTFAMDEAEVRDILQKGYTLIKGIMEKIDDKIEIDVVGTWNDFSSVLNEVGQEKEIKEIKERLSANPKAISVDDQMKVGLMVKKALDKKRERYADEIQNVLKAISQNFKIHELMDDNMVMNTAFLIDKDKQKNFEEKIEELNNRFNERLNFRCVGPLPPYSFYTLEIKKMQFEEIYWARKKLDLGDIVDRAKIKEAYRTKAVYTHPDRNPEKPDIGKEFNEMNKAYKILEDYCLAAEQLGQRESFCFKEEELKKNAILVRARQ